MAESGGVDGEGGRSDGESGGVDGEGGRSDGESGGSDGYEYVTLTAAEVLEKLEEAWQNERFAPELLEHKTEVVDCILDQIKEMEENLSHSRKGDFVAGLHQLELNRVRYVLCGYLRTRLQKIEKHVLHVLEQEADSASPSHLSPEELVYAKEFADNLDSHLHSLVLSHMPSNLQKLDRSKAVSRPNMDSYVFIRAVERTEQVNVDPDDDDRDPEDLDPGTQCILKYRPISSLVQSGAVRLV